MVSGIVQCQPAIELFKSNKTDPMYLIKFLFDLKCTIYARINMEFSESLVINLQLRMSNLIRRIKEF